MENRGTFASKFGILAAMAGSAIGLGNLWRFPYMVGTNGGAAFIIIYLFIALVLCIPIMYAEFIIGRRSGCNAIGAFKKLAPHSCWPIIGVIGVIASLCILSFYSVVGGWTIDYFVKSLTFQFHNTDAASLGTLFGNTVSAGFEPILYLFIFLLVTALIVVAGVEKGIEKYAKIMMPLLFVMVIIIAIRSITLPNARAGLSFLFNPDFSKVTPKVFLDAMGQAFFSLSLGMGCILTYGSYVKKSENIVNTSFMTAISDTLFALIAGLAIMPAVFSFGVQPTEGPGLVFVILPSIFQQIPFGAVLAILFFLALFIAALTSSISLFEVVVAFINEELKFKRWISVLVTFAISMFFGVFCSLSQGVLSDVKILGFNIFDLFDKFSSNILLPLGGLLIVIFVGWRMKKSDFIDEITSGGTIHFGEFFLSFTSIIIKYIAPIVIAIVLVRGVI